MENGTWNRDFNRLGARLVNIAGDMGVGGGESEGRLGDSPVTVQYTLLGVEGAEAIVLAEALLPHGDDVEIGTRDGKGEAGLGVVIGGDLHLSCPLLSDDMEHGKWHGTRLD
jgi:hypothetical protein